MELLLRKLCTEYNKLHGPPSLPLPAVGWCAGDLLYPPHQFQIAVFSCDSSSVCCYGKCEVQSLSTVPKHQIITMQISTQYPPHLDFLPTGMVFQVLSWCLVFLWLELKFYSFGMTWGFSSVDNILDCFVCMFIFSVSVFM